jgi:hypothetical protein
MGTQAWSAGQHRLLVVDGTGLIDGTRVGVAPSEVPAEGRPGLLRAGPAQAGPAPAGVRLVPAPGLPPGRVAVPAELAGRLGLAETGTQPWRLTVEPASTASAVTLEPLSDGSLDGVARDLQRAGDVCGQVFWWGTDAGATAWVHAAGAPFRVRQVAGPDGQPVTGLVEIGAKTQLTLFSPGNRTGVDIVVLADCSGSMALEDVSDLADIPVRRGLFGRGGAPERYLRRSEALRRALHHLLAARQQVAGRVSRIALVQFTDECRSVFPRAGGMAEMGADSTSNVINEFRHAIGQLIPQQAGTDIGRALHYASELLYRHGVPDNDALIVLVSDGAHWTPRGEEATGETVAAADDPVSLMEELHQAVGIRLHAIGIGDEQTFHAWWRRYRPGEQAGVSIIPNHRLLGELVRVGGGDPTRIGGVDVLEEYFGGLGTGVSRTVGTPAPPALPPVQPELAEVVRRTGKVDVAVLTELEHRADQIRNLYSACAEACRRRAVDGVFRPPSRYNDLANLGTAALSRRDFHDWIQSVNKVFNERLDERLRTDRGPAFPVAGVRELLRDGRLGKLRLLRNDLSHDSETYPKTPVKVGEIYAEATGLYALTDDDSPNWARMQLACFRVLTGVLAELHAMLSTAPEAAEAAVPEAKEESVNVVGWSVTARRS